MDINSMNSLFSMITLLFSVYCLYAWYQLRGGTIPQKFALLPKEFSPEKCLDQELYVRYLRPRLLVFSILMVLTGVVGLLDARLGLFEAMLPGRGVLLAILLTSVLPLAVVIWFCVCLRKIQKELW